MPHQILRRFKLPKHFAHAESLLVAFPIHYCRFAQCCTFCGGVSRILFCEVYLALSLDTDSIAPGCEQKTGLPCGGTPGLPRTRRCGSAGRTTGRSWTPTSLGRSTRFPGSGTTRSGSRVAGEKRVRALTLLQTIALSERGR